MTKAQKKVREYVKTVYPKARCSWSALNMGWVIKDHPGDAAKVIGRGKCAEDAWSDAEIKIALYHINHQVKN